MSRKKQVILTMTPEEEEALMQEAQAKDLNRSDYIRSCINLTAGKPILKLSLQPTHKVFLK